MKDKRKIIISIFLSIVTTGVLLSSGTQAPLMANTKEPAFRPGERLTYELRWENVKAGKAVLEVLPMRQHNGDTVYHFALTVRSTRTLDKIYKVRDRIDAYADADLTRSVFYKQKLREGGYRKDDKVNFHWDKQEAEYIKKDRDPKTIPIMEGTFDPLSAFYYVRNQHFAENMELMRPVSDGKKNVVGKVAIIKREKITTRQGTYDTFLVEPELKDVGGVFKKSKDAKLQIWVTADARRMPVMVKSKVVIGHFVGELVTADFPAPPQAAVGE